MTELNGKKKKHGQDKVCEYECVLSLGMPSRIENKNLSLSKSLI